MDRLGLISTREMLNCRGMVTNYKILQSKLRDVNTLRRHKTLKRHMTITRSFKGRSTQTQRRHNIFRCHNTLKRHKTIDVMRRSQDPSRLLQSKIRDATARSFKDHSKILQSKLRDGRVRVDVVRRPQQSRPSRSWPSRNRSS